jgi:hypothetical protein
MEVLMGKSSINGSFSMALLNNQMVYGRSLEMMLAVGKSQECEVRKVAYIVWGYRQQRHGV